MTCRPSFFPEPTRYDLPNGLFVLSASETDSASEEDISKLPCLVRKPDADINSSYTDLEDTGTVVNYVSDEYVDEAHVAAHAAMGEEDYRNLGLAFIGRCKPDCQATRCNQDVEATFSKVEKLLQKSDAKNAFKD